MKKIASSSILLSAVALTQLNYVAMVNAFTVEVFKSNGIVNSLDDADALIEGINLDSTASGYYEFIDFKDVAYGSWGHSDIDHLFPGTPGYPNTNNFAVRATAKIIVTSAGNWTFLTTSDDGVRLRINGSNVILSDRLQADKDNLGTVYLPVGSHNLELVLFESDGEATLELWAAPGIQKKYNSNFKLVRDTVNGEIAPTNSALARRNTENFVAKKREKANGNLSLAKKDIENPKKAVTAIVSKSSYDTDIILALVLGIALGIVLMLLLNIILFLIFMGWYKFYRSEDRVVSNSEIVKANSILESDNIEG